MHDNYVISVRYLLVLVPADGLVFSGCPTLRNASGPSSEEKASFRRRNRAKRRNGETSALAQARVASPARNSLKVDGSVCHSRCARAPDASALRVPCGARFPVANISFRTARSPHFFALCETSPAIARLETGRPSRARTEVSVRNERPVASRKRTRGAVGDVARQFSTPTSATRLGTRCGRAAAEVLGARKRRCASRRDQWNPQLTP